MLKHTFVLLSGFFWLYCFYFCDFFGQLSQLGDDLFLVGVEFFPKDLQLELDLSLKIPVSLVLYGSSC